MPSIGQNLKPFNCNGDISSWVKNSRMGRKTTNKQANKTLHTFLKNISIGVCLLSLIYFPIGITCSVKMGKIHKTNWNIPLHSFSFNQPIIKYSNYKIQKCNTSSKRNDQLPRWNKMSLTWITILVEMLSFEVKFCCYQIQFTGHILSSKLFFLM